MRSSPPPGLPAWPCGPAPLGTVEKGRKPPTVDPMSLMVWPVWPPMRLPAPLLTMEISDPHSPAGTAMRSSPPPGLPAWPCGPAPLGTVEKGRKPPTVDPTSLMVWPVWPPMRVPAPLLTMEISDPHSPAGTAMRSSPPPGLPAWPCGPAPLGTVEKGRKPPTVDPTSLMVWPVWPPMRVPAPLLTMEISDPHSPAGTAMRSSPPPGLPAWPCGPAPYPADWPPSIEVTAPGTLILGFPSSYSEYSETTPSTLTL